MQHAPTKIFSGPVPTPYFPFSYPLDDFQLWGCRAIDDQHNLMVCAHTGSGKTALALYAIARCMARQERVIYISPIKTLSNQKYKEFSSSFPSVGILTGDIKVKPDADCLIMTAEILRNFLMTVEKPSYFSMDRVSCVILDEVHFINNPERGRVWEEIILYLDPTIQLVMLSATLSEPLTFAQWVQDLKQVPCHLVSTVERPVPLQHFVYWDQELYCFMGTKEWNHGVWKECKARVDKHYTKHHWSTHVWMECLGFLQKKEMLPATVFLLNRDMVEKQARHLCSFQQDPYERATIEGIWDHHMRKYAPTLERTSQWSLVKDLVLKGIGIHHSGMIPLLKEIVEILYTQGLLPVLLATETFAMGVNAPTKTVVFTNLSKFDGKRKRFLYSEEYLQMAGRAGRRGLDTAGTVVILPSLGMATEEEMRAVATKAPQTVQSRWVMDFSMAFHDPTPKVWERTLFYRQSGAPPLFVETVLPTIDPEIWARYEPLFQEKKACYQRLTPDGFFRLDKKVEKTVRKRLGEIRHLLPKDMETMLSRYHSLSEQCETEKREQRYFQERWTIQVDRLQDFLVSKEYWGADKKPTRKGLMLQEVHDGNPLLLAEVLHAGLLDPLEASTLVAMLSIFVADKEKGESHVSLGEQKEVMDRIRALADKGLSEELVRNQDLPFPFFLDWTVSPTMYHAVKGWYEGQSWVEVRNVYEESEGNFIKNMLRVVNFIQSIHHVAEILSMVSLQQKLENVQEKMMRDLVMNDSLYITR